MKSKKILLVCIVILFILISNTGCSMKNNSENTGENVENQSINEMEKNKVDVALEESNKEDVKNIFLEVLDNKRSYVDESNETIYLNDYLEQFSGISAMKVSYTILDMDNDGDEELIALFEETDGFYLILNYEDGIVYGFEDVYRGLLNLKTNGYYWGSGGAATGGLSKSTFERNVRKDIVLAEMDMGNYKINEKTVTKEEFDKYLQEEFYSKEDVKWTEYKDVEIPKEEIKFEEGTYVYTVPNNGSEIEGSKQTITFENKKVKWEDGYFGATKTGSYIFDQTTVTVSYTEETVFKQGEDKEETNKISEKLIYKIIENGLSITKNGVTKVYTKK